VIFSNLHAASIITSAGVILLSSINLPSSDWRIASIGMVLLSSSGYPTADWCLACTGAGLLNRTQFPPAGYRLIASRMVLFISVLWPAASSTGTFARLIKLSREWRLENRFWVQRVLPQGEIWILSRGQAVNDNSKTNKQNSYRIEGLAYQSS
jgi:hypothetical protein